MQNLIPDDYNFPINSTYDLCFNSISLYAGEAKVLQVFYISEGRSKVCVAGCRCTKGALNKKKNFKVLREGEIIFQGEILQNVISLCPVSNIWWDIVSELSTCLFVFLYVCLYVSLCHSNTPALVITLELRKS